MRRQAVANGRRSNAFVWSWGGAVRRASVGCSINLGAFGRALGGETRLPALPRDVSKAVVAVWQQAVLMARADAEEAMAEQRQVLSVERERLRVVEDRARKDAAQFRQQAAEALTRRQAAET